MQILTVLWFSLQQDELERRANMNAILLNNKQKGVGIIEVLVAMLILAVGLLGLAGLQAQSVRFNHEAYLRTQATVLANDMIDRMRANRTTAVSSNSYNFSLADVPTASSTACETAACSGAAIAQYDFTQWRANIASALPGGLGSVSTIASVGIWKEFEIQIEYNSVSTDQASGTPDKVIFTYRTRI